MYLSAEVIAALLGTGVGFVLTVFWSIIHDHLKEKHLKKEGLASFKMEIIHIYKDNEYNYLHTGTEPDLPTIKLRSNALEELIKNKWIPKDADEKIMIRWKHVDDINRAIDYKEDSHVRGNSDLLKKQNEVIVKESTALREYISELSELNLDGLGDFTCHIFGICKRH